MRKLFAIVTIAAAACTVLSAKEKSVLHAMEAEMPAQESARTASGSSRTTGRTTLPAPWCDLVEMNASGKTDFTIEAEYFPTNYNIKTALPGQGLSLHRDLNTASLGLILDSPVAKNFPLYIDYGVKLKYSGNKFGCGEDCFDRYHYMAVSLPLGLLMKASLANTPIKFAGFLGLDGNFYPIAQVNHTVLGSTSVEKLNDKADGYRIFNLDWHCGCRIYFDKYFFGVGYEGAVTPIRKCAEYTEKMNNLTISLGVTL